VAPYEVGGDGHAGEHPERAEGDAPVQPVAQVGGVRGRRRLVGPRRRAPCGETHARRQPHHHGQAHSAHQPTTKRAPEPNRFVGAAMHTQGANRRLGHTVVPLGALGFRLSVCCRRQRRRRRAGGGGAARAAAHKDCMQGRERVMSALMRNEQTSTQAERCQALRHGVISSALGASLLSATSDLGVSLLSAGN
jgi:hypothetical protein